jgi:hypothetical protein
MGGLWEKYNALLRALPAQLAAVQSILTVLATELVPLLPDNVALRASAWLVLAAGWVATAVRVVSRVTPVPVEARGLVLDSGELTVEHHAATGRITGKRTVRAAES